MRIVFFGTPQIAVYALNSLLEAGFEVVAVVTGIDKPAGRGKKLLQSDVKKYALEKNLPLLQPEKLKNEVFLQEIKNLNPDLMVVVAFRMMPQVLWNIPKHGTLNMHTSLLPDYRGAAPINHVIINGEKETGVTIFRLNENIDEGDILSTIKIPIDNNETAGSLHDKLMVQGSALLCRTLKDIDTIVPAKQIHKQYSHPAPKIYKQDCLIDWNKSAEEIDRLIRGLSPYPASFTRIDDETTMKIFDCEIIAKLTDDAIGKIISDGKNYVYVKCSNHLLSLKNVQLSGKKPMSIKDFLRGFNISEISSFY